ncbi:hypothetical protein PVAND_001995 [Polypedilum vanderplanki]|uniref:Metalloendopeptidase n=1 Tax=Polypedilum vanderplanki TaxID=319348 RepID=A0A9J6BPN6_POLVA|nr:hypothetical protein PVAND_001995 [Polypedilum vanderplanki]
MMKKKVGSLTKRYSIDTRARTGVLDTIYRWPKVGNLVYVPYVIGAEYPSSDRKKIIDAMDDFHELTCIRFIPRTSQSDYITIKHGDGCASFVGNIGGEQEVTLHNNGCILHEIRVHELIHTLGYMHMQSSADRDSYMKIIWENIESGMEYNFDKVSIDTHGNFGTSYDYESIMHYGGDAYSINGEITIETLDPSKQNRIGKSVKMSSGDIARVKNMYNCS